MTETPTPRLTLWERWRRLRRSPRFPFVLFFAVLVAGGISQVYYYWWGVRIQRMVARHKGNCTTNYSNSMVSISLKQTAVGRFMLPLEPINSVCLSPKTPVPASDIGLLKGMWSLSGLGLFGPVESDSWRQVGSLRNLMVIHADGPDLVVRDCDLEQIARLRKLNYLLLTNLSIELGGLRHFARHTTLTGLEIHYDSALGTSVAADGSEKPNPRQRVPTELEAASFRELATNHKLKRLTLTMLPDFGDEHLLALTSALPDGTEPLPSLTKLRLSQTSVTNCGVRFLGNLPSLEELDLRDNRLGDGGLQGLKHNPTVRVLDLYRTQIGDSDVETLLTMSTLRDVNVAHTNITEQGLLRLATHQALRRITVGTNVPEATVLSIREHTACRIDR